MQRMLWRTSLAALVLVTLSCNLVSNVSDRISNLTKAPELWSDVPRMDGLAASDKDMPVFVKVIVRSAVSNLMSGGTGTGDWILFTTDKTPDDVKAFYTNELMAENGWEASDTSTCVTGSAEGVVEVGVICMFQKQVDDRYTGLAIIGSADAETQQTNVIFVRIEDVATDEP